MPSSSRHWLLPLGLVLGYALMIGTSPVRLALRDGIRALRRYGRIWLIPAGLGLCYAWFPRGLAVVLLCDAAGGRAAVVRLAVCLENAGVAGAIAGSPRSPRIGCGPSPWTRAGICSAPPPCRGRNRSPGCAITSSPRFHFPPSRPCCCWRTGRITTRPCARLCAGGSEREPGWRTAGL